MERHFIIPASIAAALHAGLLFGIRPDHAAVTPLKNAIKAIPLCDPFFVDPPAPEVTAEAAAPLGAPGNARPIFDEPPVTAKPANFVIEVPIVPASDLTRIVTTIPLGPVGLPEGKLPGPGIGAGNVIRIGDLDSTPRTRVQSPPVYPYEAKKDGRGGEVLVEFTVDETGAVLSPRVVRSTDSIFDEPAVRAIARWKFEPGKRGGNVVRFRMAVPLVFSITGE